MLTESGCLKRREKLWRQIPGEIEWVILGNPKHIYYMCGFLINPISFSEGERCFLIMERGGGLILVADNLSLISSETQYYVDDVIDVKWYDQSHSVSDRTFVVCSVLAEKMKNISQEKIYTEKEWLPAYIKSSENQDTALSGIILKLRRIKFDDEIDLIKMISKASTAGHNRAREVIGPGIGEMDIYREVSSAVLKELENPSIIYGDFRAVNAELPECGGPPTSYKCKKGDLFILDYSVLFHGYRTDCTNTLAVGDATDEQYSLFEACLRALYETESYLIPGNKAKDVFSIMHQQFIEYNLGNEFGHHAGHGLGLSHPEAPCFGINSDEVIMEGEVVTLEPGVYKYGVGGVRIERNYLVTKRKPEILTTHILSL